MEWWKFEASRVNLNFFYCVLTCHTCDHAIKVSRFLFSPFHPQTEKDRHVWETATCAFLIIPRYFLLARIITPAHVTVPHTRYSTLRAPSFLLSFSFLLFEWTLCATLYNPDRKIFLKSRISRIKNNVVFLSLENKIGNERKKEFIFTIVSIVGKDIGYPRFRVNGRTSCSFYWWWIATISARSSVYG